MRPDEERRTVRELGFKVWLRDVLIYHYKWHIIGVAAVIIVAASLIWANATVPENDASVILAVSKNFDSQIVNDIKVAVGEAAGDVSGDGQVVVNVLQLLLNPADGVTDSVVTANAETMVTSFLQNEFVLYIFDEANLAAYAAPASERFSISEAAAFGGTAGAIDLTQYSIFADIYARTGVKLYACLREKGFTAKKLSADEFYAVPRIILNGLAKND